MCSGHFSILIFRERNVYDLKTFLNFGQFSFISAIHSEICGCTFKELLQREEIMSGTAFFPFWTNRDQTASEGGDRGRGILLSRSSKFYNCGIVVCQRYGGCFTGNIVRTEHMEMAERCILREVDNW